MFAGIGPHLPPLANTKVMLDEALLGERERPINAKSQITEGDISKNNFYFRYVHFQTIQRKNRSSVNTKLDVMKINEKEIFRQL